MTCYARAAPNDMVDGPSPKVHPAETNEEAGSILTGWSETLQQVWRVAQQTEDTLWFKEEPLQHRNSCYFVSDVIVNTDYSDTCTLLAAIRLFYYYKWLLQGKNIFVTLIESYTLLF